MRERGRREGGEGGKRGREEGEGKEIMKKSESGMKGRGGGG